MGPIGCPKRIAGLVFSQVKLYAKRSAAREDRIPPIEVKAGVYRDGRDPSRQRVIEVAVQAAVGHGPKVPGAVNQVSTVGGLA